MTDTVETASVKLVTIIGTAELSERIASALRAAGATGYTVVKADGWGQHGSRRLGIVDGGNIRFETLVVAEVARKILARIASTFSEESLVAFAIDAEAIPRSRFQ